MKEMLSSQRFRYWPVNSIAYYALRNNIVNASLATWYNYITKLGWDRPQVPKKPKYETGIRMQSIKQAYEQYIMVPGEDVRLIVDGGVENNNNTVDETLEIKSHSCNIATLYSNFTLGFAVLTPFVSLSHIFVSYRIIIGIFCIFIRYE